jgi:hypothetical protein
VSRLGLACKGLFANHTHGTQLARKEYQQHLNFSRRGQVVGGGNTLFG